MDLIYFIFRYLFVLFNAIFIYHHPYHSYTEPLNAMGANASMGSKLINIRWIRTGFEPDWKLCIVWSYHKICYKYFPWSFIAKQLHLLTTNFYTYVLLSRLCMVLANLGYECKEVSANISVAERQKILNEVNVGTLKIVVCSDALGNK